jgi:hypothetical protein
MRHRFILGAGLAAFLLAAPAWPAPVLAVLSNVSGVPCDSGGSWEYCRIFPEVWSATGPIEGAGTSTSSQGMVYVAGRADFGNMGLVVRAGAEPGGAVNGTVQAFMQDVWTIGGGAPGAVGSLDIEFTLHGSYEFNWSRNLSFYIGIDWPGGTPDHVVSLSCRIDRGCDGANPFTGTAVFHRDINFDNPFTVVFSMTGDTGALNGSQQSIDAWSSARITGFTVRDSEGRPMPEFTLTAESGHDYLASDVGAVPEPASWTLLVGAAALVLCRKRLRRA